MTTPAAGRYSKEFLAGWGAMDFNGHMANSAYLNLAADARMAVVAEHGFAPREVRRRGLGPVLRTVGSRASGDGEIDRGLA